MIDWLFSGAAAAYGLASALLLAYLIGGGTRPAPAGLAGLGIGALLHVTHDAMRWSQYAIGPFSGVGASLSTLALLAVIVFLLVRIKRQRVDVVGAFVAPVALILLLGSRMRPHENPEGGALLATHIGANLLGVGALTVGCGMAIAYLLQERQVKARHLGGLFHRLPPLDVLDAMAFRCVAVGLPALTVGVITGFVVSARGPQSTGLPWQQYFAMISWALFAAVFALRVMAGWRGRRAAIGTILGYASSLIVLLFYSVRGGPA